MFGTVFAFHGGKRSPLPFRQLCADRGVSECRRNSQAGLWFVIQENLHDDSDPSPLNWARVIE